MNRKLFIPVMLVCLLVFFTNAVAAQEATVGTFGLGTGFGFGTNTFNLTPMQNYPGYDSDAMQAQRKQAMAPVKAGALNMLGGLWSWQNGDIFGGAMTAGLEGGGLALAIVGFALLANADNDNAGPRLLVALGGTLVFTGGAAFGYFRGSSQYKKMNSVAWTGNPMDHITAVALPTPDGIAGSLMFRAAF